MKKISYGHQWIDRDDIREVVKALKSDWLTQGPRIRDFEKALCRRTGARYAVAVSSGTAALHIACLAAGIEKNDEVITSPVTFVASSNCILYCGAKPVFADIQEDTVNIDPKEIGRKINKKTKAIIPVHFAGHPCDLVEIHKIAGKYGLIVIEDACHALGAEYKVNGRWLKIGSCKHSDMTVFSFHPVKSITTGEGGAVTTNNKKLYERLLVFRNHGISRDVSRFIGPWYYEMQHLGFNYRITDIQCALGISQLRKLKTFIGHRREAARLYNDLLCGIEEAELPVERDGYRSAWHLYPVRIKKAQNRKMVFENLHKNKIGVQVHYIPVHLQPYYRKSFGYKRGDYPVSERYYERAITLPIHFQMKTAEIKYVTGIFKKLIR